MILVRKNSGFSLIELMVVIAIIATVVSLSLPILNNVQDRARDAEAPLNTRQIYSLSVSFFEGENDKTVDHLAGASIVLTDNNYSTTTSCLNSPHFNYIGFKVTDCRRINFIYGMTRDSTARKTFTWAVEGSQSGKKRVYRRSCGSSIWYAMNGSPIQLSKPVYSTPEGKIPAMTAVTAKVGTDIPIDFDNDGAFSFTEIGAIFGVLGTPTITDGPLNYIFSCT